MLPEAKWLRRRNELCLALSFTLWVSVIFISCQGVIKRWDTALISRAHVTKGFQRTRPNHSGLKTQDIHPVQVVPTPRGHTTTPPLVGEAFQGPRPKRKIR